MNIDTMPLALIDVPIKIVREEASICINHINLFRERNKAPLSEFSELADVLSRLSLDGYAIVCGNTVLEWRYNLSELDHVRFVIDKYVSCARWYRVTYE